MNFFKGTISTISGISYFEVEGESMFRLPLSKRMANIAEAHYCDSFVLGVRPEHFSLCTSSDPAAFHAKVDVGEPLGAESYIHLSTQKGNKVVVRLPGVIQVALGEELYLKPDLEQAHLFDATTEKSLSHPSKIAQ
jgi:ABC-type sugar transport system ATPase subunit